MIDFKVPQETCKIQAIDIDSTGTYVGIVEQGITKIWNLRESIIRNSYKTVFAATHLCKFSSDSTFFLFTNGPASIQISSLVNDFSIQLPAPSEFSLKSNLIIKKTTNQGDLIIMLNLSTKKQNRIYREKLAGVSQNEKDFILLGERSYLNENVTLDFWSIDILKLRRSIKLHNYFDSFKFQSVQGYSNLYSVLIQRYIIPKRVIGIFNTFQHKLIAKVPLEYDCQQFQMCDKYLISLKNNKLYRLSLETREQTEQLLEMGRIYSISNDCQHVIGLGNNDQIIIEI